jgi:hypothetical protein
MRGGGVTKELIHWECHSPDHRALRSRRGNGGVTIYESTWAYCDGDTADDRHLWVATGGVPMESLIRWTSPIAAPSNGDGPTVHAAVEPAHSAKPTKSNGGRRVSA